MSIFDTLFGTAKNIISSGTNALRDITPASRQTYVRPLDTSKLNVPLPTDAILGKTKYRAPAVVQPRFDAILSQADIAPINTKTAQSTAPLPKYGQKLSVQDIINGGATIAKEGIKIPQAIARTVASVGGF